LIDALQKAGLAPNTNEGNFFAYLNNEYVSMTDLQGNPIDPRSMSEEQMLNTMFPKGVEGMTPKEQLSLVHNNFALNALIVSEIDKLALTPESGEVSFINGFGKFGLKVDGGKVAYPEGQQDSRSVNDLLYNDSDGNGGILIYDFKRDTITKTRTAQTITNLEDEAQTKLRADVKEGLGDQYDDMLIGTDRYYVIIKLPNGTYAPVTKRKRSGRSQRSPSSSLISARYVIESLAFDIPPAGLYPTRMPVRS